MCRTLKIIDSTRIPVGVLQQQPQANTISSETCHVGVQLIFPFLSSARSQPLFWKRGFRKVYAITTETAHARPLVSRLASARARVLALSASIDHATAGWILRRGCSTRYPPFVFRSVASKAWILRGDSSVPPHLIARIECIACIASQLEVCTPLFNAVRDGHEVVVKRRGLVEYSRVCTVCTAA